MVSFLFFILFARAENKLDNTAIQSQVNAMKSEVTNAKTQVIVLKDLLRKEGLDGSRRPLTISFKNEMSKRYAIDSITYKLNGDIVYQFVADDSIQVGAKKYDYTKDFETKVVPGPYALEVQVVYRGNDTGVFSYIKNYRVTREQKTSVDVKKNTSMAITIDAYEEGGLTSEFKDRPQLKVSQTESPTSKAK